ncbi:hypothetical protein R3P38DRAFT_2803325 [Favolaschia claudopus]|uniref:Uncharacterized protein n=1 Tax=Favolaschia claudopus TaxID=2862362 RepID=A0AAV9ZTF9_9AGAR
MYDGELVGELRGVNRREVIAAYRAYQIKVHGESVAANWPVNDPGIGIGSWKLVGEDAKRLNNKRKASDDDVPSQKSNKPRTGGPPGLRWDPTDYSCAYDSLLTILRAIWRVDSAKWGHRFGSVSRHVKTLANGFERALEGVRSLEDVRDEVRRAFWILDSVKFPKGHAYTSLGDVSDALFGDANWGVHVHKCFRCGIVDHEIAGFRALKYIAVDEARTTAGSLFSISEWFNRYNLRVSGNNCANCGHALMRIKKATKVPPLLVFVLSSPEVIINRELSVLVEDVAAKYYLSGVVYSGKKHFTSRVIKRNGDMWYNDGIETGRESVFEGVMQSEDIQFINYCLTDETTRGAAAIVYALAE